LKLRSISERFTNRRQERQAFRTEWRISPLGPYSHEAWQLVWEC